jgi:hypothetical protein
MIRALADSVGAARRIAFVGLAKNTGKTVALGTLIGELTALGRPLAITSIGRDGEEVDAIQPLLRKPPITCPAATLVATTMPLLRRAGAAHDVLIETATRTPLGRVVIARMRESAQVEVAGPSSSTEIRDVVEEMLALGAEHAVIDGSIDRRAAAAPNVADAVVISTGAVLGEEIDEVVRRTGHALEVASLPSVRDRGLRDLALRTSGKTFLVAGGQVTPLPVGFALTVEAEAMPGALRPGHGPRPTLVVGGVLPERLLEELLPGRTNNPIGLVAADPTKVFVSNRPAAWYRQRGLLVEVLNRVRLTAITVNPRAPLSHQLDSSLLRAAIAKDLPAEEVPVVDVKGRQYRDVWRRSALRRSHPRGGAAPIPAVG